MSIDWWLDMFFHTHSAADNMRRSEWPDGGSYMDQPNILIELFDIAKSESLDYLNEKRNGK